MECAEGSGQLILCLVRRMKNVALIRVPTVEFSREEVPGHSMFRGGGVDAFTDQLSERLRAALSQRSIPCTAVARTFKPCGSGFTADNAGCRHLITVCAEPNGTPGANITIRATPRRNRSAGWESFEPAFHAAVEAQFPRGDCQWMTLDEFIESAQSV